MITDLQDSVWIVVPVYNNPGTLRDVVQGCLAAAPDVLVVDDGSTTGEAADLLAGMPVTVLRHARNKGKGAALLTGLRHVAARRGRWMVTIDADGQHDPADLGKFLPVMRAHPDAIIIGARDFSVPNVPASSRFGRKFSNFWIQLETGIRVDDSQSGFRAYPVALVNRLGLRGKFYDFEIEVLVRAAWAGLKLRSVPINVWYAPPAQRISSFDTRRDNRRISQMHARLIARRLMPWPTRRLVKRDVFTRWELLRNPRRCLLGLLRENSSPAGLSVSAGVGILLGALPLIAMHSVAIVYVTTRLSLNKLMALSSQTLCVPPFVPLLCIEVGHFMRFGRWLPLHTPQDLLIDPQWHLLHWLLGSLVVAPLLGLLGMLVTYGVAKRVAPSASAPETLKECA